MIYDYFFLLGGKKQKDNKKEESLLITFFPFGSKRKKDNKEGKLPTTPEKLFVSVKSYMSSNALRFGFV